MSEDAKAANSTSKKPIYKKWWFWTIIIVVIIGIGGAGAASNKDPKKVDENGSVSEQQPGDNDSKEFTVGDVIAIDGHEVTVESVKRNWSSQYSKPKDGKEYVKVAVKIENKSDDKISYNGMNWTMEDSDGAVQNMSFVTGDDTALNSGELVAGGKKTGTIVFEVPKDDKGLKVHYKPNVFLDREAIIKL